MRFKDMAPEIAGAVSNSYLQLIMNTTEKCNLGCPYCNQDFHLQKMSRELTEGIVKLVKRRMDAGLKTFEFELFGGEPLAAWDVVEFLVRRLFEVCRESGTHLQGSVTTNGVLLNKPKLDLLVAHGASGFQITLDGPQQIHDR